MRKTILTVILTGFCLAAMAMNSAETIKNSDREYWCKTAYKISLPVLEALSQDRLKVLMPMEQQPKADRSNVAYLEAMGRLLCGIAPWLESGESTGREGEMRAHLTKLAHKGIHNAVNPKSADYMNFTKYSQPLVDAAFLAQAFLRSPKVLWGGLDAQTKQMTLEALRSTRVIKPGFNNWLLFSATIEAFFLSIGEQWDPMRVDYAMKQHEQWYKGDGVYGDGPNFHWDYYNSFVIQPMMVDIATVLYANKAMSEEMLKTIKSRSARYAEVLEHLISPEGTYPPIGRSLAYRFGAFQTLAQTALLGELPQEVTPAQVRCALTAVMKRQMETKGTFDGNGWLTIGFCGSQISVGEGYICTGSAYLCSVGLLPLGLPASDPFWSGADTPWTQVKAWSGQPMYKDSALGSAKY